MSVRATVTLDIRGIQTAVNDLGAPQFPFEMREVVQFEPGTAALQANQIFADTRTLAASATENLDLNGTALVMALSGPMTITRVKTIAIRAAAGNTNNVTFGPAAANGFLGPFNAATDRIIIPPGGEFVITHPGAGWLVTAATNDLITLANSGAGTSVTYDILIIGSA